MNEKKSLYYNFQKYVKKRKEREINWFSNIYIYLLWSYYK